MVVLESSNRPMEQRRKSFEISSVNVLLLLTSRDLYYKALSAVIVVVNGILISC